MRRPGLVYCAVPVCIALSAVLNKNQRVKTQKPEPGALPRYVIDSHAGVCRITSATSAAFHRPQLVTLCRCPNSMETHSDVRRLSFFSSPFYTNVIKQSQLDISSDC